MLRCPKCGYDNELGRIFCHSCGAKLDLNQIKPPGRAGRRLRKKGGVSATRLVRRVIEVAVLALVVLALYLAAQVPTVRPISTTSADLVGADRKRFDLEQLAQQRRPGSVSITEAELNAFIDALGFEKPQGKGIAVVPSKVQIELGEGETTVIFRGRITVGGQWNKNVLFRYTGVPMVENGQFVYRPVAGAVGALPIHPWILKKTGLFDRYFGRVFGNLKHEKQLLDKLTSISVNPRRVLLSYQPAVAPAE